MPSGDIDGGGAPVVPVTLGPQVFVIATPPPAPAATAATAAAAAAAAAGAAAAPGSRRPEASPPTSRVFFTGSMTTFSVPVSVVRTYQKRPSGSQVAFDVPPTTRPLRLGASILTARS